MAGKPTETMRLVGTLHRDTARTASELYMPSNSSKSIWSSIKRIYLLLMEIVFQSDYQGGTRKEFSKLC